MDSIITKIEYPPLLEPGFHEMTLMRMRAICVDAFPLSSTRQSLMDNLEEVIAELISNNIVGDIWIDGSFATCKTNPNDVDFVVCVDANFIDSCSDSQWSHLCWIAENLKESHCCDSYVCITASPGHPLYSERINMDYWTRWFGHARDGKLKGIVVVKLK